jgi:hypothetical protein
MGSMDWACFSSAAHVNKCTEVWVSGDADWVQVAGPEAGVAAYP